MSLILTFLGATSTHRIKIAVTAAKLLSGQGKRVLLAGNVEPTMSMLLNFSVGCDPQEIAINLHVVYLQASVLLERSWNDIKQLESEYLKTPLLKEVYGQELAVLPGMDSALALNAIRQYDESGNYDVIIYCGYGDSRTIRMFGMPDFISWYWRRFHQLFVNSDIGKILTEAPIIQTLINNLFNFNWMDNNFVHPIDQTISFLEKGKEAVADPKRVVAFLVSTPEILELAACRYLWGSSQQINLTVGGLILVTSGNMDAKNMIPGEFSPLAVSVFPDRSTSDWQILMDSLPDFEAQALEAPKPIEINVCERKVSLFLPGFEKKQIKLTQHGPEVTVEAGDQRRNISLPSSLIGRSVTGAKFQHNYLIISF
ncbi:Arsenical pump-driving ATPase [Richelia intracellularis HH01]|uniref:Arsenical pump-driving ATPase n=1 Tax=Richelia intracellularis HH01 TaxID=1165094 RepID=M1WZX7_9NOST|nr:ArsA family ATPase [Richelia intracellularis]CCH67977.1 Arsenical pump-driving ATPase [Richelia intracellularis HH01]